MSNRSCGRALSLEAKWVVVVVVVVVVVGVVVVVVVVVNDMKQRPCQLSAH